MRRDWPRTAVAYQDSVTRALKALGGVDAARHAEADPGKRSTVAAAALDRLGLRKLDPWGDEEESAAVMLGIRAAGAVVLPWPLVHTLAVPAELRDQIDGVYLIAGGARRLDHADLFERAVAVDIVRGSTYSVTPAAPHRAPLDPFATDVALAATELDLDVQRVVSMHLVLDAFWVVGALSTVADLAVTHAQEREQFGSLIGKFGEIRWRLADLALACDGLAELALHAWWLLRAGAAKSADVLALRVQLLESAGVVLANGHQVLGAMGLCEEHDLTVIDRHLQAVLFRPAGRSVSVDLLSQAISREGFDSIYPVPARR